MDTHTPIHTERCGPERKTGSIVGVAAVGASVGAAAAAEMKAEALRGRSGGPRGAGAVLQLTPAHRRGGPQQNKSPGRPFLAFLFLFFPHKQLEEKTS